MHLVASTTDVYASHFGQQGYSRGMPVVASLKKNTGKAREMRKLVSCKRCTPRFCGRNDTSVLRVCQSQLRSLMTYTSCELNYGPLEFAWRVFWLHHSRDSQESLPVYVGGHCASFFRVEHLHGKRHNKLHVACTP